MPRGEEAKDKRQNAIAAERERLGKVWSEITFTGLADLARRVREGGLTDSTLLSLTTQGTDRLIALSPVTQRSEVTLTLADLYRQEVKDVQVTVLEGQEAQ